MKYRNIANIEAEIVNATICAPANAGTRKRRTSNIGRSCRNSTRPKTTSATTDPTSSPTTRPLDQPQSLPRKRPRTNAKSPTDKVICPGMSSPPCPSSRDSRSIRAPKNRQAAPIGKLTKKIHRQPAHSVSAPPTSGPIATAAPMVAPQIPKAVPRSRPWNSWVKRASETANMIAPPIPCAPRARFRNRGSVAAPHRAEAAVNNTTPMRKTRLRPSRSPSDPAFRTTLASMSEYASTTHWRSVKELCRSRWIFGSATLTTVMSSSSMKMPTQTMIKVRHFRSMAATVSQQDSAMPAGMVSDYGACAFASAPPGPGAGRSGTVGG